MQAWGPAIQRVVWGAIFVAHGVPKLVPVGESGGVLGTALAFEALGLWPPVVLAVLAGLAEVCGGVALALGLFTRWAAAVLAVVMGVAIWVVHWPFGFYLNWRIDPAVGHGVEYALALMAGLVSLVLTGPGAWSVDGRWARDRAEEEAGRARLRSGKV